MNPNETELFKAFRVDSSEMFLAKKIHRFYWEHILFSTASKICPYAIFYRCCEVSGMESIIICENEYCLHISTFDTLHVYTNTLYMYIEQRYILFEYSFIRCKALQWIQWNNIIGVPICLKDRLSNTLKSCCHLVLSKRFRF